MANTTTPKDETLDPIRYCVVPQTVTQLKAFLGSTQQMADYVPGPPDRHSAQSIFGLNTADGLLRALLCTSSRPTPQANTQGGDFPERSEMDTGIGLIRHGLSPREKPRSRSSPIHLEQRQFQASLH